MKKELALLGIAAVMAVVILGGAFAQQIYRVQFEPRSTEEQTFTGNWFLKTADFDTLYLNDIVDGQWVIAIRHEGESFNQQDFRIKIYYDYDAATSTQLSETVSLRCNADLKFEEQAYQTFFVHPKKIWGSAGLVPLQIKLDCTDAFTGSTIKNISVKLSDKYVTLFKKLRGEPIPVTQLNAFLKADKTKGEPPLEVTFDITGSIASEGKKIEKYELDFGDGTPKSAGAWPADTTPLKSIKHTYQKSAEAKLLVWEAGTMIGFTVKSEATVSIDLTGCSQCETVLQCMACLDRAFVQGVFE